MAGTTKEIIRTVTLAAGESFTLPAGSKIIGASSLSNFTSTCPLPILEPTQCYAMLFGYNNDTNESEVVDSNTKIEVLLGDQVQATVNINNLYTSVPVLTYPFLANSLPTNLIKNEVLTVVSGIAGTLSFRVTFRTTPSIAKILKLHILGDGFGGTAPNSHGLWIYPVSANDCQGLDS